MYEKNKKLDIEEVIPIAEEEVKEEVKKEERKIEVLDQIQKSILSNEQPKIETESNGDQEITNRLNLINQSLMKLDIKNLENKDLLFNSLS